MRWADVTARARIVPDWMNGMMPSAGSTMPLIWPPTRS
jgi:hypothetical protein